MSEAYARLAEGTVIVMHRANDWTNPPQDGIWYRVEYKTMVDVAKSVTTILKVKEREDGSALVGWDRELPLAPVFTISKVLAIGRHVLFWLGTKLDWVNGSIELGSQEILRRGAIPGGRPEKTACKPVVRYPYEMV